MLGGLLASVPAHSDDASELEHPAVPAIKLTLDWISANISVLQKKEVSQNSRSDILCSVLISPISHILEKVYIDTMNGLTKITILF